MSVVYVSAVCQRFNFAVSVYVRQVRFVAGKIKRIRRIICKIKLNDYRRSAPVGGVVIDTVKRDFGNKFNVYGKFVLLTFYFDYYRRRRGGIAESGYVDGFFEPSVFRGQKNGRTFSVVAVNFYDSEIFGDSNFVRVGADENVVNGFELYARYYGSGFDYYVVSRFFIADFCGNSSVTRGYARYRSVVGNGSDLRVGSREFRSIDCSVVSFKVEFKNAVDINGIFARRIGNRKFGYGVSCGVVSNKPLTVVNERKVFIYPFALRGLRKHKAFPDGEYIAFHGFIRGFQRV